jgi:hypothetical protein
MLRRPLASRLAAPAKQATTKEEESLTYERRKGNVSWVGCLPLLDGGGNVLTVEETAGCAIQAHSFTPLREGRATDRVGRSAGDCDRRFARAPLTD